MRRGAQPPAIALLALMPLGLLVMSPPAASARDETPVSPSYATERAARAAEDNPYEKALRSVVVVLPVWPTDARRTEEPEGSGVVWRDGLHVVTALHVVAKATSISIRNSDGDIQGAEIAGLDPATDLAVLRLASPLTPAQFRAREPRLGETACASGNAFGLGLSLSCGVVSAVRRSGVGFNAVEDFVQTDAAVNPGASGGALLDREGAVVGVLSAIFTKAADANIGVNFAVSVRLVERVVGDIVALGRVRRARPGFFVATELRTPASAVGAAAGRVVVRRVVPGSAAAGADLAEGDVVRAINGRVIAKSAEVTAELALAPLPGAVTLDVERAGVRRSITVELSDVKAE